MDETMQETETELSTDGNGCDKTLPRTFRLSTCDWEKFDAIADEYGIKPIQLQNLCVQYFLSQHRKHKVKIETSVKLV